ncbi:MAG: hypothetical protein KGI27_00605 [Thaumarchaeota archaeon]|nr:hypothetical protein [Nitrososphaerota archaeon]
MSSTLLTQITGFSILLNFNKSSVDYEHLTGILEKKGFKKRVPKFGYLVAMDESINQLDKERMEDTRKSIESDPEKISTIGKYCIVAVIPLNSGKQILIGHSPDMPKFYHNSSKILEEAREVIRIIKETFVTLDLSPCKLMTMISVKSDKRPYQVLANFDQLKNYPALTQMASDMELTRWENEIYLYSRDADRNTGPTPIIEDMKRKNLPQKNTTRTRGWDEITLRPRPNEYLVSMDYRSDNVDDLIQTLEGIEKQAEKIMAEMETKDQRVS